MKLRMNICDVDVWLEIYNYKKTDAENADFDWSRVKFSVCGKYINYHIDDAEFFLNVEVEYMKHIFGELLKGNIKETTTVEFAEPDFEFVMNPKRTLYDEPGKVIYKNGSVTLDISVDFKIHFWCNDGLGTNVFTMTMDREEIQAFYVYLQAVTGEIDKKGELVGEYIDKGYLYI